VNPTTRKDTNSGGAASPLRTLAKAHAGDTVKLAGGFYTQNTNEQFSTITGPPTVVVPCGVAVKGDPVATFRTTLWRPQVQGAVDRPRPARVRPAGGSRPTRCGGSVPAGVWVSAHRLEPPGQSG